MALSSSWTKLRSWGLARGMQLTHHSHELKAAMRGGMVASVAVKSKGLKRNAISFASNVVIGIASTAPAYSLASALGVIAGIAAYATPGIMLVAFIPMFCVATAYLHLNRVAQENVVPQSGSARAMGPYAGWIGGWAVIVTNIIVMPSLAAIAGEYSFQLFGYGHPSTLQVTVAGVAWIGIMTAICFIGIELSARSQRLLLAAELAILLIFAVVAQAAASGCGQR